MWLNLHILSKMFEMDIRVKYMVVERVCVGVCACVKVIPMKWPFRRLVVYHMVLSIKKQSDYISWVMIIIKEHPFSMILHANAPRKHWRKQNWLYCCRFGLVSVSVSVCRIFIHLENWTILKMVVYIVNIPHSRLLVQPKMNQSMFRTGIFYYMKAKWSETEIRNGKIK